jgi:hypothetical protein
MNIARLSRRVFGASARYEGASKIYHPHAEALQPRPARVFIWADA